MPKTHYEVLGINNDADESEIRKAYRSLSLKYHPDRNPDAGDLFREINEANEILSDNEKRQQYDFDLKHGEGSFSQQNEMNDINNIINQMFGGMGGGFPGMPGFGIRMGGMGPNVQVFHNGHPMNGRGGMDPFSQFFNQMQKPEPIKKNINITFEQSYTGVRVPVEIQKTVVKNGIQSTEIETIFIDLPQGIQDGETLGLRNKGHIINENIMGDLEITINITNNTTFTRNGIDLHYPVTISLKDALCGFTFEIKHLNGKILAMNNMTNSTIIKPNYKKNVPNLGFIRGNQTGNLIIEFIVEFPNELSKEQIEKLNEIL